LRHLDRLVRADDLVAILASFVVLFLLLLRQLICVVRDETMGGNVRALWTVLSHTITSVVHIQYDARLVPLHTLLKSSEEPVESAATMLNVKGCHGCCLSARARELRL